MVVLVHGSMDRRAGLARVARRLVGSYRTVRYDRRGYGASVGHPGPFGVADHIADLVRLIGDDEVVIIGHSMGGVVALGAAAELGPQVCAVGVYESPLSWLPDWPTRSATVTTAGAPDPAGAAEAFMRRIVGHEVWERLPASTRAARRAEGPALVGEITSLRQRAPWDAARIASPVVVGRGGKGLAHHFAAMEQLASWLPRARLVTLEGCGHAAPTAAPEQFLAELVVPTISWAGWSS